MSREAAKAMAENPELVECLFLVRKGVPFDVAFSLPPDERLAFVVVLGELDGGRFNWSRMSWETAE